MFKHQTSRYRVINIVMSNIDKHNHGKLFIDWNYTQDGIVKKYNPENTKIPKFNFTWYISFPNKSDYC